ncbi:ABC transporter substrate-binding protein [Caviibacter abscessus]|uniref:ABC transporter substrate-binding protein n=1 Tax=Caviibacter abscessus TaxID=1766719 RepID=UPI00082C87D3|nr:ABC transporter substrate-binding protein [Caviibacter abscessus]
MKKLYIIITIILLIFSCAKKPKKEDKTKFNIGILQLVAHPALDKARNGFEDAFKEKGIKVSFKEKNANGELATANLIANTFVNENVDLIYAIATTSAQASLNATKDIPIIFSAVTNPIDAGLKSKNITGVSDKINVKEQLLLLKQIKPDVKTVGFLYNSSEKNSVSQLQEIEKVAKELDLTIVSKSVTQANEVLQTLKYLLDKSDALYTPTDNLIASVMPLITSNAIESKKIVIGAEASHVELGALISKGIDYYEMGKVAGEMAIKVLVEKTKPEQIPYLTLNATDVKINKNTLNKLKITLNDSIK